MADREGFFAAAHGGTLFLDEVGELPADAQPTLLRVLEDGRITAVGSTRARTVDVRVVAATNVDLEDAVHRGAFRRDLLARLHQWPVHLPPLRARRMDIPILLRHFVPHTRFSANAMEALLLAPWPDNVRGLRNVVERAATRAQGRPVEPTHLPPELLEPLKEREAPTPRREAAPDKNALENLLRVHDCNVSAVARDLGRTRKQIYRWIERFQIDLDALR